MQKNNTFLVCLGVTVIVVALVAWQLGLFTSGAGTKGTTATTTTVVTTTTTTTVVGAKPIVNPTPATPAPAPKLEALDGLSFRITSYDAFTIPTDENYTVSFQRGALTARICNGISGPYTTKGGIITATRLMSTKMACSAPKDVSAVEQIFGTTLSQPATYTFVNNVLTISGSAHTLVFNLF